jgi:hypothetical protein
MLYTAEAELVSLSQISKTHSKISVLIINLLYYVFVKASEIKKIANFIFRT